MNHRGQSGFTTRTYGSGRGHHHQSKIKTSTFTRINPDTKFMDNKDVEGVHLVTDIDFIREMQVLLGKFTKGPRNFFSVMWPVVLSTKNVHLLASRPYVMGPKPSGPRFLLYIDPSGDIFLENNTQHIFRVDEDHAINIQSSNGELITDTILDGIITREKINDASSKYDDQENGTPGKLKFVIQDAIRCNGKCLINLNIVQRIAFIREEIIEPRMNAVNNLTRSEEKEAFDLDIVEYQEAYQTESYLSRDFTERYKYPFNALFFYPREKGYKYGPNSDILKWQEHDNQKCCFRLKISEGIEEPKEAELYVMGPHQSEIKYGAIFLTEEIKKLDGRIIDCRYFDHRWIFCAQRHDRNHPNGRRAIKNKMEALENAVSHDLLLTILEKSKGLN